ncbi:MAG: hypothetical protein V1800_06335 [Candidatus Latescibacterota bacterium]
MRQYLPDPGAYLRRACELRHHVRRRGKGLHENAIGEHLRTPIESLGQVRQCRSDASFPEHSIRIRHPSGYGPNAIPDFLFQDGCKATPLQCRQRIVNAFSLGRLHHLQPRDGFVHQHLGPVGDLRADVFLIVDLRVSLEVHHLRLDLNPDLSANIQTGDVLGLIPPHFGDADPQKSIRRPSNTSTNGRWS